MAESPQFISSPTPPDIDAISKAFVKSFGKDQAKIINAIGEALLNSCGRNLSRVDIQTADIAKHLNYRGMQMLKDILEHYDKQDPHPA